MGKVVFNMTMSLDGFVAGPNDSPDNGLGDGGDGLFKWYFSGDTEIAVSEQSAELIKQAMGTYGAGVWGRKTFDITKGWGGHPPAEPCFIVTHNVLQEWVKEGSPFTFVTNGVESAVNQAKKAAGDKDVVLCTASILQQCLKARLVDEIYVDVAPIVLGRGVRLFDHLGMEPIKLECIRAINAPNVIHLGFRVLK